MVRRSFAMESRVSDRAFEASGSHVAAPLVEHERHSAAVVNGFECNPPVHVFQEVFVLAFREQLKLALTVRLCEEPVALARNREDYVVCKLKRAGVAIEDRCI